MAFRLNTSLYPFRLYPGILSHPLPYGHCDAYEDHLSKGQSVCSSSSRSRFKNVDDGEPCGLICLVCLIGSICFHQTKKRSVITADEPASLTLFRLLKKKNYPSAS